MAPQDPIQKEGRKRVKGNGTRVHSTVGERKG